MSIKCPTSACGRREYMYARGLQACREVPRGNMIVAGIMNTIFRSLDRLIEGAPNCNNLNLAKSEKHKTRTKPRWKEIRIIRSRKSHSSIRHRRENTEIIFCKKLSRFTGMTQKRDQITVNTVPTITTCRMKPGSSGKSAKDMEIEARGKPGSSKSPQNSAAILGAGEASRTAGLNGKGRTPPSNEKMPAKRGKTAFEMVPYVDEDMLLSSDVEENERALNRSTVARSGPAWAKVAAEMISEQIQMGLARDPIEGVLSLEQGARNISLNEDDGAIGLDHGAEMPTNPVTAEVNLSEREVMMLNEMGQREAAFKARIEELERAAAVGYQGRPNEARLPDMPPSSGATRRVEPGHTQAEDANMIVPEAGGALAALRELSPDSQVIITMVVLPNDYPNSTITQERLKHIETRLNKAIEQSRTSQMGFLIEIGGISPRQGVMAIECRNVGSVNWLKFAVEDLEMGLRCEAASEAGLRPAFMIWVCDPSADFNEVAMTLHWKGVPTRDWVLLKDYGPERQSSDPGSRIAVLGRRFLILGNDELKQLMVNGQMKVQYKMYTTKATIRHLLGILDTRRTGNVAGKLHKIRTKTEVTQSSLQISFKEAASRRTTTTMNWNNWSSREAPLAPRDALTNTCRASFSAAHNKGLTAEPEIIITQRKPRINELIEIIREIMKISLRKNEVTRPTRRTAASSIKNCTPRNYELRKFVERKRVRKGNKEMKIDPELKECSKGGNIFSVGISRLSRNECATPEAKDKNNQTQEKYILGDILPTSPAITITSKKHKKSQQNSAKPKQQNPVGPTEISNINFMGKLVSYIHERGLKKLPKQSCLMSFARNILTIKLRKAFAAHIGMQACNEHSRNKITNKYILAIGQHLDNTRIKRNPDKSTRINTDRRAAKPMRMINETKKLIQGCRCQACRNMKREGRNIEIAHVTTVSNKAIWINAFKSCRGEEEYPIENG